MVPQLEQARSAGEIVRSRQVSGFILTETAYPAGFRAPRHSHELGFFYTVLDGDYTELLGSRTKESALFALAYHPAGIEHAHACGGGGRCFNIYPVERERFQECTRALGAPTDVHGALLPWLVTRLYREFARPAEASPLAMEGLALEIRAEATRPSPALTTCRPPRWLEETCELLHARFSESITVAEVARHIDMNPAYLARVFREQYRCTIGDYVRRLRVEFACRRLCASDASLAMIALDAGFVDQSHFTKSFKSLTGMTPAQFRAASYLR
jgi:AraC family transcriptional regulator